MKSSGMVTMTTDFGTVDGYVGAVKGVIVSIYPKVTLMDLTNDIPSYDIVVGAFHLGVAFSYYPKGTVHLAVVDPGVGSRRKPILVQTQNYFFVAPDNGLLSVVLEKDPMVATYELTEEKYFRGDMSSTFHGRDLFGPVAAHLARGVSPSKMGPKISQPKSLKEFEFQKKSSGWEGKVLFFDKFGNAFTNIHGPFPKKASFSHVELGERKIPLYRTYSEIPVGEPGALFGSAGYLEIALREDHFQNRFNISRGESVKLVVASF